MASLTVLASLPGVAFAAVTPTTTTLDVPGGTQYGSFIVTAHVLPAPQPFDFFLPAVSFLVDGNLSGVAPLDANGDGSTDLTLGVGSHSIVASFGGLGDYQASQSAPSIVTVGLGTTVALESSRNPALTTQSVTITATVGPESITGGTLSIVDAFDGSTIASGSVGPGTTSVAVTRTFAAGDHQLTASYSGDGDYGPSTAMLDQAVDADSAVDATGMRVDYTTFYPYKDGYRDVDYIRGRLNEPASVLIRIYNPGGSLIKTFDLGARAPGDYVATWTGRNASGAVLPEGTYKVVQRLTDSASNVLSVTSFVTLSRKKLIWTTATISLRGNQYAAAADPGSGSISGSKSAYSNGVLLSSGTSGVAVAYKFTLHSGVAYSSTITFGVLGRSPNGRTAAEGLWNRSYCPPDNTVCYDYKAIGPGYQWWTMRASEGLHVSARTAYGIVLVPYTGVVHKFDVAKVRLVYRWASLGY
jgi:Big-like domain-containing protein/flagellar hook capping protein FlgD